MKPEEELVYNYYLNLKTTKSIVYEPDGNIPPDFLLNKEIAIEVRRLNQHFNNNGTIKPLEDLEYKLVPKISNLCEGFPIINNGTSTFIYLIFSRPILKSRIAMIYSEVKDLLTNHPLLTVTTINYKISKEVSLELLKSTIKNGKKYIFGGYSDLDQGGWVIPEMVTNLKYVIKEKAKKISVMYNKYPVWWLVLVDYISHGLTKESINEIKNQIKIAKPWDDILIFNLHKNNIEFQLYKE